MKAYFVSSFGDITVGKDGENVVLKTTDLTLHEEKLLKEIISKYKGRCDFEDMGQLENTKMTIKDVKLEDVHKLMKKVLKKNKPTLTAIKFKDGKLELVNEIKEELAEKAESAVTTEKPRRGCPMPNVTYMKEVRASNVLKEFLTEKQLKDFEKYRSFISIGNHTEHPYRITSRWSSDVEKYGQVFDVVEKRVICANCIEIPPSEEMLAMKLSVELNEKEFLMR